MDRGTTRTTANYLVAVAVAFQAMARCLLWQSVTCTTTSPALLRVCPEHKEHGISCPSKQTNQPIINRQRGPNKHWKQMMYNQHNLQDSAVSQSCEGLEQTQGLHACLPTEAHTHLSQAQATPQLNTLHLMPVGSRYDTSQHKETLPQLHTKQTKRKLIPVKEDIAVNHCLRRQLVSSSCKCYQVSNLPAVSRASNLD